MSAKRALILLVRIIVVFSSLQFMRDAFYRWDGYSYYMRFSDFIPDLSLIYVFSVAYGILFAVVIWAGIHITSKLLPKRLNIRFEHLLTWIILCVLLLICKKVFARGVSLTELLGLNYFIILTIGSILVMGIAWLLREYSEKILERLNNSITPLVWLFVLLLIVAVPASFIKKSPENITSYLVERVAIDKRRASLTASDKKRPNIVMVVMDTLTARDMQLYGYHRPTTPFISDWAKGSTVFNRAYSSSNWTTPSMMSMLTGQRPWTHKIWYRAYYNHARKYDKNMTRVLKDYGYSVYGLVQNHFAHPEVLGIGDSFFKMDKSHTFRLPPKSLNDKIRYGYFAERPVVADWVLNINPIVDALVNHYHKPLHTTLVPPELVYNNFLELIDHTGPVNDDNKPFFALLHVYPPHTWYLPPKPYLGLYGDGEKFNTDIKQERVANGFYPVEEQYQIDILRKRYDEFILYSDKQFELFMSHLADSIDMSSTIVILPSGHGASFSHGYQEHDGPHLYESMVHVPLIIKSWEKEKGRVVDMPVEITDIAPTILDLAGIPVPHWMEGRSLYPIIKGDALEPRLVFSMQLIKNRAFGHPIRNGTIAVWDRDFKLIHYLEKGETLLFNIQTDPDESQDLSQENPEIRERLMKIISANLSEANAKIMQFTGN